MPAVADAHVLQNTLQLPERAPYKIQVGEHVGVRNTDSLDTSRLQYDFEMPNGHALALRFNSGAGGVEVHYLSDTRAAVSAKSFETARLLLNEAAVFDAPVFSPARLPDLAALTKLDSDARPADMMRGFADALRALEEAATLQAERYARLIYSRVPADLRGWVADNFPLEDLNQSVADYGTKNDAGEMYLFSTKIPAGDTGFESEGHFVTAMERLKTAWDDVVFLDVKKIGNDYHVALRPVPAREEAKA